MEKITKGKIIKKKMVKYYLKEQSGKAIILQVEKGIKCKGVKEEITNYIDENYNVEEKCYEMVKKGLPYKFIHNCSKMGCKKLANAKKFVKIFEEEKKKIENIFVIFTCHAHQNEEKTFEMEEEALAVPLCHVIFYPNAEGVSPNVVNFAEISKFIQETNNSPKEMTLPVFLRSCFLPNPYILLLPNGTWCEKIQTFDGNQIADLSNQFYPIGYQHRTKSILEVSQNRKIPIRCAVMKCDRYLDEDDLHVEAVYLLINSSPRYSFSDIFIIPKCLQCKNKGEECLQLNEGTLALPIHQRDLNRSILIPPNQFFLSRFVPPTITKNSEEIREEISPKKEVSWLPPHVKIQIVKIKNNQKNDQIINDDSIKSGIDHWRVQTRSYRDWHPNTFGRNGEIKCTNGKCGSEFAFAGDCVFVHIFDEKNNQNISKEIFIVPFCYSCNPFNNLNNNDDNNNNGGIFEVLKYSLAVRVTDALNLNLVDDPIWN